MKEKENHNENSRILVLCCSEMAEDAQMLLFMERLKAKFPLRICMIPKAETASQVILEDNGWSTRLPERVLSEISFVLLAGISKSMIEALENGWLNEPEVKLLTLCFANRIRVYFWEENPWKESVCLPEPVQKMQEKKKKICEMYHIQLLKEQELEKRLGVGTMADNRAKHHVYTMEDVSAWEDSVTIPKDAYFTPLASDYIREKKICVKYQ